MHYVSNGNSNNCNQVQSDITTSIKAFAFKQEFEALLRQQTFTKKGNQMKVIFKPSCINR